ncbi:MAG: galactokinase [Planctomycetes bacterium]|nr:galactokinase [Planctomycetota bacterium]
MSAPPSNTELVARVRAAFQREFGGTPVRVFFAPGRVNLVGAHLDYSGGDVLPLAVDRGVYVAAALLPDARIRLRSLDQEGALDLECGELGDHRRPGDGWAAYPLGVLAQFRARTGRSRGVAMLFGGDLPMASGLSSSAAIELATALAFDRLCDTGLTPLDLARLAHRAENRYVGVQCGIMDQYASALGQDGKALLLHCRSEEVEHVPLDRSLFEILVMDTRKPRTLASTGFNQRVRECADALAVLRTRLRPEPCLAAYEVGDLADARLVLQAAHFRRFRHVVTEQVRVAAAVECLRRGDVRGFGAQLDASHASSRDDYEVSCPELDLITAAARACPEVFGARLVGGGFGGCAIALIRPGSAARVEEQVAARYRQGFGVAPAFYVLHAGAGPREVTP